MKVNYRELRHFCGDPVCLDPIWKLSSHLRFRRQTLPSKSRACDHDRGCLISTLRYRRQHTITRSTSETWFPAVVCHSSFLCPRNTFREPPGVNPPHLGNATSHDSICCAQFCADSSSPQISAILVDHFTGENDSLRKSQQSFHNNCADKYQNPGSRNSLPPPTALSPKGQRSAPLLESLVIGVRILLGPRLACAVSLWWYRAVVGVPS